jgi:hypothetical protein
VRFLLRRETRAARVTVLRERLRALGYGDDTAELYLALKFTIWGVILLLPGDGSRHTPAWRVLREILRGDTGIGVVCLTLGVMLILTVTRLLSDPLRRATLLATLTVSVGFAVGFLAAAPASPFGYDSLALAFICWLVYQHTDRD